MSTKQRVLDEATVAAIKKEFGWRHDKAGNIVLDNDKRGLRTDICRRYRVSYAQLWHILHGITHRNVSADQRLIPIHDRKRLGIVVRKRRTKQKE